MMLELVSHYNMMNRLSYRQYIEGLAEAAEVRVAYHMGNGRPDRAKKCAYKSILLGFQIAVFSTGALYILAEYIPKWITPDPTLQKMIYEVLPLLGIGQIAMSLGIMCWSVIGAQGRYRLATTIEFIGSWFFVIPLCAVLVYGFHFNLQGMVGSTVLGYAISGAVNLFVVLRSDWKQLSDIVVARHEDEESSSSSSSSSSASAEDDESNAKSIASDAASSSADRPQPRTD
jgi:Na+-driven multidrug efflux pump